MECQRCKSKQVARIAGHCDDCFDLRLGRKEYDGYVPQNIGIGGGDDIYFSYCLDCGQIQGEFPIKKSARQSVFKK